MTKYYAILCKDDKTPKECAESDRSERMGTDLFISGEYKSMRNFIQYNFKNSFASDYVKRKVSAGGIWRIYVGRSLLEAKYLGLFYDALAVNAKFTKAGINIYEMSN